MENLIHKYTRENMFEDGLLVDVTKLAKEAGFSIPVALDATLHNQLKDIPEQYGYQDYTGRLWDLLFVGTLRVKTGKGLPKIEYEIICPYKDGDDIKEYLKVAIVIGPGDNGEPVLTIYPCKEKNKKNNRSTGIGDYS